MSSGQTQRTLAVLLTVAGCHGAATAASIDHGIFAGTDSYGRNHACVIDSANRLTLVDNGQACAEIVVPVYSSPVVRFAAAELRTFVQAATGADLPVVSSRSGAVPCIMLGTSAWLREWGLDVATFPRDAFIIRRMADMIVIAGRDDPWMDPNRQLKVGGRALYYDQGTLFGVYDFAERFLGARFFFPGDVGTVIPKAASLAVPVMDIYEAPDFIFRKVSYGHGAWFEEGADESVKRLKGMNQLRLRGQTWAAPNCHGLARLGYLQRFGQSNPEYFSLLRGGARNNDASLKQSGHFCFSNPDVIEEIYRDAEAYLTAKPASCRGALWAGRVAWDLSAARPGYFNIMPQDGLGQTRWCRCPACAPYWDNEKQTEYIWGYTAQIAKRLSANGIPGYITNMAYGSARAVPQVQIPENVLVMVAVTGPWNEKFPDKQKDDDQIIRDWNAKLETRKVWLWNYAIQAGGRYPDGVPPLATRHIASYYTRLAPDILGAYIESEIDYFLFNYLNWYVFHRIAWDTSTDVDALLKDHHQKLFGPGAKPMGQFFDTVETLFTHHCLPEQKDTPLGPVAIKKTFREIWEEIFTPTVFEQLESLYDEAEQLAANDRDALTRIRWFRDQYLGHMRQGQEQYLKDKRELEDLVLDIPLVPEGETVTIDGQLEEQAWKSAAAVHLVPLEAEQDPAVDTTVRTLWTPSTLYIAYEAEEPLTDRMTLATTERDDKGIWQDSSVEIFIDPTGACKSYVQLMINAKGVVTDVAWKVQGAKSRQADWEWNAKTQAVGRTGKQGYTLEIALPIADLAPEGVHEGTMWIANFCRNRCVRGLPEEENQCLTWSPFLLRGFHNVDRFGRVRFVKKND